MIQTCLAVVALVAAAAPSLPSVELTGFPFVRQKPDFCGEADVEMALGRLGHRVSQDQVFGLTGVDPLEGRGAWTNELAKSLRALGIEPGKVWNRIDPKHAAEQTDAQWRALHADLVAGQPSIVCMHYSQEPQTTEHFRLVTGYDARTDEVIYQEPAEDDGANRRMKRGLFLDLWTFKPAADRWTMIRFQLPAPARAPVLEAEISPTRAEVAQHVIALKESLPAQMTLVWEKPFLVVGNEGPAQVKERAKSVVRWTRDLLLKDFFAEAPRTLQEVWILKDRPTYEKYSRELFKTNPETPYGYYLSDRRALVMNIKPGYGTLTHEMVHPFMHHAWDDAEPGWLNEGVASLFERPAERDGHLVGKVNWRLPALLEGLKDQRVPSFKALVHLSSNDFYEDPSGTHYAAARYLCYWLQEKGLLAKFVRRATALKDQDPSGWKALTEVLGADPESFRPEWEKFVKALAPRA
ncbi:MAG: glycogen branching enzyme [Myxococcaceae bacterium]|nr:glycogen branching enzyme [Myxococcaceae bacterium]